MCHATLIDPELAKKLIADLIENNLHATRENTPADAKSASLPAKTEKSRLPTRRSVNESFLGL